MQEAQSRRLMREKLRDAAESEPDHVQTFDELSTSEKVTAVKDLCTAEISIVSGSSTNQPPTAALIEEASNHPLSQLRTSVAKNRQKQLQQWAAARPTVPITSFYFTAPSKADLLSQVSPTRVLLSGLGADELCGGYARYRTAHRRGGEEAARASMKADMDRIWLRNLGRDDRCAPLQGTCSVSSLIRAFRIISDNGREMRTPYLDHSFIALLQLLPTSMLINAAAPSGVGDKVILRQAAARIGLISASERPKRAIQFGSRIAKQLIRSFFGASCSGSGTADVAGLCGERA